MLTSRVDSRKPWKLQASLFDSHLVVLGSIRPDLVELLQSIYQQRFYIWRKPGRLHQQLSAIAPLFGIIIAKQLMPVVERLAAESMNSWPAKCYLATVAHCGDNNCAVMVSRDAEEFQSNMVWLGLNFEVSHYVTGYCTNIMAEVCNSPYHCCETESAPWVSTESLALILKVC